MLGEPQPVVGPVELLLGRGEGELGLSERRPQVGWPAAEPGAELGLLGQESLDVAGGVVDSEAGLGEAAEGVEDLSFGRALVGENYTA